MQYSQAKDFLSKIPINNKANQKWADLGCGDGLFTKVLAEMLPSGSEIYAVDRESKAIINKSNVKINDIKADFEKDDLNFPELDGIMMANSLHYIEDKISLLTRMKRHLKKEGKFVIIEYDMVKSHYWVPYPVSFHNLKELFAQIGFNKVEKLEERKSLYGNYNMYLSIVK